MHPPGDAQPAAPVPATPPAAAADGPAAGQWAPGGQGPPAGQWAPAGGGPPFPWYGTAPPGTGAPPPWTAPRRPGLGAGGIAGLAVLGAVLLSCAACCFSAALVPLSLRAVIEEFMETDAAAKAASCAGFDYPGRQARLDVCAPAGGTVDLDGLEITVAPLTRAGGGRLCTAVTFTNTGFPVPLGGVWRLQTPGAQVRQGTPAGMDTAELPGGQTRGAPLCFGAAPGAGTWLVTYLTDEPWPARGVWVHEL